ncbi:LCP family protein [Paenibacillus abyssi]|uniref:Transcriptional regulator LytR n=1 Tax=Paenibacillus abyssi TaxID=1340531 RepID=A0A917FP48_9BACL|nr:LCP family protein [Paenibacillus abyssi]GGF94113.1 transcriptional regulator LytR [Paenibacillus abyssi]
MRILKKHKWLTAIAAIVLLTGTIGYLNRSAIALWAFDTFLSADVQKKLEKSYKTLEGREPAQVSHKEDKKPFSLLLLGIDQRGHERGRSDTMIYTVVRPVDRMMLMVSIPRDSYVEIPGRAKGDKITHAYVYGKAKLAIETVEKLFDTRLDHYAAINFEGFRDVIDAMGGIALPIEKDLVNDDPYHEKFVVKAGQNRYNGKDALNYVRYREDVGGDVSRTQRHQIFITALLDKATEFGQWTKIPQLIDIMGDNFTTDLAPDDMIDLAKSMVKTGDRTLYSHTLKGEGRRSSSNGLWYYYLDEADLEKAKSWINSWMNDSLTKAQLPIPDPHQTKRPAQSLPVSEVVQP